LRLAFALARQLRTPRRNLGLSSGGLALSGSDGVPREQLALRLYEAQRGALVAYAARMLGDVSRAEDIVQDAWLLFDRLPDKQTIHEPLAYLRRMVRNLSINALRHVALRQKLTDGDMEAAARTVADPAPSVETEVIARQRLARFMARLATLPERQQTAIRMHRLEGLKMREIAEHLGVSITLVHGLIAEGLVLCADPAEGQA